MKMYCHLNRLLSLSKGTAVSAARYWRHRHRNFAGTVIRRSSSDNGLSRVRGAGGISEERQISQAFRTIRGKDYQVVVEVMNACHVDWADRNLPNRSLLRRSAKIWIRVLTHADMLSKEALRYQMERASLFVGKNNHEPMHGRYQVPVVALNLHDVAANTTKMKRLKPLMQILLGARMVASSSNTEGNPTPSILVCGVPNAGKSSFVFPLTKNRTLQMKKKKGHHLPKINSTAGWTMGVKSHAFELKIPKTNSNGSKGTKTETVSLVDTPGLRPRLFDMEHDEWMLASWLATEGMTPQSGMLSKDNNGKLEKPIRKILWRGLQRHAQISSKEFEFKSPDQLWSFHKSQKKQYNTPLHHFIQSCSSGKYGGLLIEDETTPSMMHHQQQAGEHSQSALPLMQLDATIMAMNSSAKLLARVGEGKHSPGDDKCSQLFLPKTMVRRTSGNVRRQGSNHHKEERNTSTGGISSPRERRLPRERKATTSKEVFVGNLNIVDFDKDAVERELREIFRGYGEILSLHLPKDKDTGNLRGFGFVKFGNLPAADKAIRRTDGKLVMGRRILVQGADR